MTVLAGAKLLLEGHRRASLAATRRVTYSYRNTSSGRTRTGFHATRAAVPAARNEVATMIPSARGVLTGRSDLKTSRPSRVLATATAVMAAIPPRAPPTALSIGTWERSVPLAY